MLYYCYENDSNLEVDALYFKGGEKRGAEWRGNKKNEFEAKGWGSNAIKKPESKKGHAHTTMYHQVRRHD